MIEGDGSVADVDVDVVVVVRWVGGSRVIDVLFLILKSMGEAEARRERRRQRILDSGKTRLDAITSTLYKPTPTPTTTSTTTTTTTANTANTNLSSESGDGGESKSASSSMEMLTDTSGPASSDPLLSLSASTLSNARVRDLKYPHQTQQQRQQQSVFSSAQSPSIPRTPVEHHRSSHTGGGGGGNNRSVMRESESHLADVEPDFLDGRIGHTRSERVDAPPLNVEEQAGFTGRPGDDGNRPGLADLHLFFAGLILALTLFWTYFPSSQLERSQLASDLPSIKSLLDVEEWKRRFTSDTIQTWKGVMWYGQARVFPEQEQPPVLFWALLAVIMAQLLRRTITATTTTTTATMTTSLLRGVSQVVKDFLVFLFAFGMGIFLVPLVGEAVFIR